MGAVFNRIEAASELVIGRKFRGISREVLLHAAAPLAMVAAVTFKKRCQEADFLTGADCKVKWNDGTTSTLSAESMLRNTEMDLGSAFERFVKSASNHPISEAVLPCVSDLESHLQRLRLDQIEEARNINIDDLSETMNCTLAPLLRRLKEAKEDLEVPAREGSLDFGDSLDTTDNV